MVKNIKLRTFLVVIVVVSILVMGCVAYTQAEESPSKTNAETKLKVQQKDGKYGVVNTGTGEVVVPFKFEFIDPLSDTPSRVVGYHYGDRYENLLNKKGEWILPYRLSLDQIVSFKGPVTAVMQDRKWGLVNQRGQVVLPLQYDSVSNYEDTAEIKVVKDGETIVIRWDEPTELRVASGETWEVRSVSPADSYPYQLNQKSRFKAVNHTTGETFVIHFEDHGIKHPENYWLWNDVFVVEEDEAIFNVFDLQRERRKDRFQMGETDRSSAGRFLYRSVFPRCNIIRPRNISAGCPSLLFVYDLALSASENELAEERKPFSKDKGDVRCCYLGIPIHPLYSYATRTFEQLPENTRGDWTNEMGMGGDRGYYDFVWEPNDHYVAFKMADPVRQERVLADMRRGLKDLRYIQGDFIPERLYEWEAIGDVKKQEDRTMVYNKDQSDSVILPMTFKKPEAYLNGQGEKGE